MFHLDNQGLGKLYQLYKMLNKVLMTWKWQKENGDWMATSVEMLDAMEFIFQITLVVGRIVR
jgi:hypothetical protein